MIEVRNLVKRYGDNLAVDHISFTIEKGKIYGFLGPNGAGKSTTMNIMTGYLSPTEGEVVINGYNVLEEPEKAKQCIGYLPEFPPLYMDMTVKEYLYFAAELKGVKKGKIDEEVKTVVRETRLEPMFGRLIGNLSKGYKQRVGLAQAIIGSPETIILDEPTVGLDPKQIIEIRNLIRQLAANHTIILSSHILSEVQEVCDHIIIINHGRLLASGTPAELEGMMGSTTIQLTLKADDMSKVKGAMFKLDGVSGVACKLVPGRDELSVALRVNAGRDLREDVFRACVDSGFTILMLKASEFSLEDIFLEFTNDEKAPRMKAADSNKKGTEAGKE